MKLILLAVSLMFILTACGGRYENAEQTGDQSEHYEEVCYEEVCYGEVLFSGRTRQEYLEDLDFLYNALVENFPFFGVIYRSLGVDMHSYFQQTREIIETTENIWSDASFANIIGAQFLNRAGGLGHLNILDNTSLRFHVEVFNDDFHNGEGIFVNFLAELDNPATRALHGLTDEDFTAPATGGQSLMRLAYSHNIETEILEAGRIAYVNIRSMSGATMHLDEETLLEFFHEVADYEHLIIDIRQNGGGDSRFFPGLVVAPNISEPLKWEHYLFLMGGQHNNHILTPWLGTLGEGYFQRVNDEVIERLPELMPDDLHLLEYYFLSQSTVYPSSQSPIFGGKIWLLVSEWVFSASEQAAHMAKQTGFATLVGQTTGGDGLGFQPIVLALPHTGIVVRYSSAYGVDNLGRNNQEFGTEPCVFNMPGKDALQTVLYLIDIERG